MGDADDDYNKSLAVDNSEQHLILVGATYSANFPVTPLIGAYNDITYNNQSDGYITDLFKICYGCRILSSEPSEQNEGNFINPNPCNGIFNLNLKTMCTISIYDVEGKMIRRFKTTVDESLIDLADLQNGLYVIKIEAGNEMRFEKLIINK